MSVLQSENTDTAAIQLWITSVGNLSNFKVMSIEQGLGSKVKVDATDCTHYKNDTTFNCNTYLVLLYPIT